MAIYDRDFASSGPIHRQLDDLARRSEDGTALAPAPVRRRHLGIRGTRPWAWVLLGLMATAAVGALAAPDSLLRRLHVEAADHTFHGPMFSSHAVGVLPILGPKTLVYGTLFFVSGRGTLYPGNIVVLGSWNDAPLHEFASSDSQGDPFHFVFDIDHRGTLFLKVIRPDGQIWEGTYRVVDHSPNGNPPEVTTGTA